MVRVRDKWGFFGFGRLMASRARWARLGVHAIEERIIPATFTVTTLIDNVAGSLRAQISAANALAGDDTINFSVTGPIVLSAGELSITDGVVIAGPGITVSGNNVSRVFNTASAPANEKITLVSLLIVNGLVTGDGGGILAGDESLTLLGCSILGNTASGSGGAGGGIAFQASPGSLTVTGGSISGNHSNSADAGGIYLASGVTANINACSITSNTAADEGGAIHSINGSMTLTNCTLAGNTAITGAGLQFRGTVGAGGLIVRNCTISGNTSNSIGGGIGLVSFTGGLVVQNSTITANKAGGSGGGGVGRITGNGTINLESSIVSGNTDTANGNEDLFTTGSVYAKYSAVGTTTGATTFTPDITSKYLVGVDLKLGALTNNGGATNTHLPANDSPLIDKGSNPAALTTDQRGQLRALNTVPDIGAVEVVNLVVRNNSDSGKDSMRQMVLDANAISGANTITFDATVFNAAKSIALTNGELLVTDTLTITGPGQAIATVSGNNNSRIFHTNLPTSGTFIVSGLTLSQGQGQGGAVRSSADDQLQFSNCTISDNSATGADGGGFFLDTSADLKLTDCIVADNDASIRGGGLFFFSGGSLIMTGCTVSGNAAGQSGGGVGFLSGGSLVMTGCTVSGNSANGGTGGLGGGGIYFRGSATTLSVTNSTLSGNVATSLGSGGGIDLRYFVGTLVVQNSTFTLNKAGASGGAIGRPGADNGSKIAIDSSILFGDICNAGPEIFTTGTATVNTSLMGSKSGITMFAGDTFTSANIGVNPLLGPLANNGGSTLTHLPALGSAAIDNGSNPGGLTTDQRGSGHPRNVNAVVDIGAIETTDLIVRNTNDAGKDSLRQRVLDADAITGANTITFDPTVFASAQTIKLLSGEITIDVSVTITGPAAKVTIDGNAANRIFNAGAEPGFANVILERLDLTNGKTAGIGGAIFIGSDFLTLRNCTITNCSANAGGAIGLGGPLAAPFIGLLIEDSTLSGNVATVGNGGAISNTVGSVTIRRSTLSGNTAAGSGGAISHLSNGTFTIEDSTLSGNTANTSVTSSGGGAVYSEFVSEFVIRNSTLSGNSATSSSGGAICLRNFGDIKEIQNCTIFNNTAGTAGGGIARTSGSGSMSLVSTIVAGNHNSATPDLSFDSSANVGGDNNLVGIADVGSFTLTGKSNLTGTKTAPLDAKLGPLSLNGGASPTHLPAGNSPVIDKGNNASALTADQRGFARQSGVAVDIGAVERQVSLVVDITADEDDGKYSKGDLSLREAVGLANAIIDAPNLITFDPAVFATATTITLTTGVEIGVDRAMTIAGPTAGVTLSGSKTSRVFNTTSALAGTAILLERLTLIDGKATGDGGAITIGDESVTMHFCTISNSTVSGDGGAISISGTQGSLVFEDGSLSGNSASDDGGALATTGNSALTIRRSTLAGNTATDTGGAVSLFGGKLTIEDSTLSGNTAQTATVGAGGGGLFFNGKGSLFVVSNSTFSGNSAPNARGGGMAFQNFSVPVVIRNSTLFNNSASAGGGLARTGVLTGNSVTLSSTVVAGNSATSGPDLFSDISTSFPGNTNLIGVADVGNVTMSGSGNLTGTQAVPLDAKLGPLAYNGGPTQTHALLAGSPAINAGSNPAALPTDQRGIARIVGGNVDIGAVELQNFVVLNENDSGTGSLRQAILDANTFGGFDTVSFDPTFFSTPRTIKLTSGELAISDTVLIVGPGSAQVTVSGNNTYRVINTKTAVAGAAINISGLTITGGKADISGGGGILVQGAALSLANCVITGNKGNGAGVQVSGGSLTATECTFSNGSSGTGSDAGGISSTSKLVLHRCTVSGNSGGANGGGIHAKNYLLLDGCTISGNQAFEGGGVFLDGAFGPGGLTILNTTISGNTATGISPGFGGGIAMQSFNGTLAVFNSTFTMNKASGGGAIGFLSGASSTVTIESSILFGDIATMTSSPEIVGSSYTVNTSLLASKSGASSFMGDAFTNANIGVNPLLGSLADNGGPTLTHMLGFNSPAIDKGSNPVGLSTDQRGVGFPRVVGPATDIGAFEFADSVLPQASASFVDVTTGGATSYPFTVTYTDNFAVKVSTVDDTDIRVTGPGGFNSATKFVNVDVNTDGTPRVGSYNLTPPGGFWDSTDSGDYTVTLSGSVTDTTGNSLGGGVTIGTFTVNVPVATVVTNAGNSGFGSLRQAVLETNAHAGTENITFDATFFSAPRTITLTTGEIVIDDSTLIKGPGAGLLTISGNNASRVFSYVDSLNKRTLEISDLTITQGKAAGGQGGGMLLQGGVITLERVNVTNSSSDQGGGMRIAGGGTMSTTATLTDCFITGNQATTGPGGGISVGPIVNLTIQSATISGNQSPSAGGGGLYFNAGSGTLLVETTTISGNQASGGGVQIFGPTSTGTMTIRNCTISGNIGSFGSGGISVANFAGTLELVNCTVTGNTGGNGPFTNGGGIGRPSGNATITIQSSIVSGNSHPVAPDIGSTGTVNVNFSAIGSAAGFTPSGTSGNNLPFGTDLKLGPLSNNGGPTQTHALLAGSPAINAGSNPAGLTTDQRGTGFPRVFGAAVDIGAFEVQLAPPTVSSIVINDGSAQRSLVTSLKVSFSEAVNFPSGVTAAFTVERTSGGPLGQVGLSFNPSSGPASDVTITFNNTGAVGVDPGNSLSDGRYLLTIVADKITGSGGSLDGDNDGVAEGYPTDNKTMLFHRLFGDADGNATVNSSDFGVFRTFFGLGASIFDFTADGSTNSNDFAEFRKRFGLSI